jgi:hypothetical protein
MEFVLAGNVFAGRRRAEFVVTEDARQRASSLTPENTYVFLVRNAERAAIP